MLTVPYHLPAARWCMVVLSLQTTQSATRQCLEPTASSPPPSRVPVRLDLGILLYSQSVSYREWSQSKHESIQPMTTWTPPPPQPSCMQSPMRACGHLRCVASPSSPKPFTLYRTKQPSHMSYVVGCKIVWSPLAHVYTGTQGFILKHPKPLARVSVARVSVVQARLKSCSMERVG